MKFQHFIFDFDGTLVDSMPYWAKNMVDLLEMYGVEYPANIIEIVTPLGNFGSAKYFREELGVDQTEEELCRQMSISVVPKYRDEIPLKEGVLSYLQELRDAGCKLHVLTASPHVTLDVCLKRNGIYDLVDNVWSIDDFGLTKSNPQIYLEAIKRLGTTVEKTVFFDDNIGAVQTAMQAGLFTVGCYDDSGKNFQDKLKTTCDKYIHSFSERPFLS